MSDYQVLPPLASEDLLSLKASLECDGQLTAIVVDEDGKIIDGHHRAKILGSDAKRRVIRGLTEAEKKAAAFRLNAGRNLSPDQKRESRLEMRRVANALRKEDPKKNTQERVAQILGVAQSTVSDWWNIRNIGSDKANKPDARVTVDAESKQEIIRRAQMLKEPQAQIASDYGITQGRVSQILHQKDKIEKAARKEEERTPLADDVEDAYRSVQLFRADITSVCATIQQDTIDWIVTDPPYPKEYLECYSHLGEVANEVLTDNGGLICMVGQTYLPEVIGRLSEHLTYWWTLAYLMPGAGTQQFQRKVNTFWKPVLVFSRCGLKEWFGDVCKSDVMDKEHHRWGQSESGIHDIVMRFTRPGEIICDPFLGGGTTAIVSISAGRRFIGSDIEQRCIDVTRARIDKEFSDA